MTAMARLKSANSINGFEIQDSLEIGAVFASNSNKKLAPLASGEAYSQRVGRDQLERVAELIGVKGAVRVGEEIGVKELLDADVLGIEDSSEHLCKRKGADKGMEKHVTREGVDAMRNKLVLTTKGAGLRVLAKNNPVVMHLVESASLRRRVTVLKAQELGATSRSTSQDLNQTRKLELKLTIMHVPYAEPREVPERLARIGMKAFDELVREAIVFKDGVE